MGDNDQLSASSKPKISSHIDEEYVYVEQYKLESGDEDLSEIQASAYAKHRDLLEFAMTIRSSIQNSGLSKDGTSNIRIASLPVSAAQPSTTSPMIISPQNGFHNGGIVMVDPNVKLLVSQPGPLVSSLVTTPVLSKPRSTIRIQGPSSSKVLQAVNRQQNLNTPSTLSTLLRPPTAKTTPAILDKPKSNVTASKSSVVDLTDEDERQIAPEELPTVVPGAATGKEDVGKTSQPPPLRYPSLLVVARTSLSAKSFSQAVVNAERRVLDVKMKKVLQMPASVFTEYLLQQRLLKAEQICPKHPDKKLKLGMYSDHAKFPYSGGYVWIGDCCSGSFTSVFKGSIFEIGPHPPSVILKLIYHWSCQTSVPNVLQWVKVDNNFLKTFYMYLRASCTAAIHEKYGILGLPPKCTRLEVGVISLGTSSGARGSKEVRVDILGVMDYENKKLRLKALDHLDMKDPNSKSSDVYLKKFSRILETLRKWVNPNCNIVTDFAIDKTLCSKYGFTNMFQSNDPEINNKHIMEYLRFVVPRMFQNTLNLLSKHLIQQCLDELVWRETWGPIPSRAFDTLVNQLADQTKLQGWGEMSVRYTLIASNPHKDWKYFNWPTSMKYNKLPGQVLTPVTQVTQVTPVTPSPATSSSVVLKNPVKRNVLIAPAPPAPQADTVAPVEYAELAQIALEPYYYGFILGDPSKQKATGLSGAFLTECIICGKDFDISIGLTNHLVHHALNRNDCVEREDPNIRSVCKFCSTPVINLKKHLKELHHQSHLTTKNMCKICNKNFKDEKALINHMIYTHVELDMPYFCEICEFRTSVFQEILTHFGKNHMKDAAVQCPFCLKVVRVSSRSGEDIPRNQLYFIQHVQKHCISKSMRRCEKCALSFTNLSTLKNHQENFHMSCTSIENVERYDCNPNDFILMYAPLNDPPPPMSLTDPENFTLKGMPLTPSITISPDLKNFLCAECDGPITRNHFCVRMTCTKCSFQTCCANAIKEHNVRSHWSPHPLPRRYLIGGRPFMSKPLYCGNCLYTSKDGNAMAIHLVQCSGGRAIAYSDKRRAAVPSEDELPPPKRKKTLPNDENKDPEEPTLPENSEETEETPPPSTQSVDAVEPEIQLEQSN